MSLQEALRHQSGACAELGSPFNARLLALAADRLTRGTPIADRLLGWPGDITSRGASVPLRLAGSLHAMVLSGKAPGLAACYPPNPRPDDDTLWAAVEDVLTTQADEIDAWLDSPPQTNEVGRSAVLIAAGHWLAAEYALPMALSELGASAGLNLFWDRYALALPGPTLGPADPVLTLEPDWTGALPPQAAPEVVDRRGADLMPLDPTRADDRLRLAAYIWPDQAARHARTRAALASATPVVDRADAADWLEHRLVEAARPGRLHMLFHTIAWQYFPPEVQARARAAIEAAGARATPDAPLAWLSMEADDRTPGAGLHLRLWPGDRRLSLGRVDFHGRWVDWAPELETN